MADFSIQVSRFAKMTEEEALDNEWDMVPTLTHYPETLRFCQDLERLPPQLVGLVSRHLGIPPSDFVLLDRSEWVWGSFNICLPLHINDDDDAAARAKLPTQAILRLALPFRCGEDYSPGSVDEKLRCEAATYVWLRLCCPSLPTPRLIWHGLSREPFGILLCPPPPSSSATSRLTVPGL